MEPENLGPEPQDMWSFADSAAAAAPAIFNEGATYPVAPSSYGRPDEALGQSPYENPNELVPVYGQDGSLQRVVPAGFLASSGYGQGPGNQGSGQQVFGAGMPQEERFGDASQWVMGPSSEDPSRAIALPWAVQGAQPMRPMMEAITRSERIGQDLDRRGTNIGPMMGSVLNRMAEIDANQNRARYNPEYQRRFEDEWVDNAANNNLLTVRPEEQADGSIRRVYTFESGRQESEGWKAAPPPPPRRSLPSGVSGGVVNPPNPKDPPDDSKTQLGDGKQGETEAELAARVRQEREERQRLLERDQAMWRRLQQDAVYQEGGQYNTTGWGSGLPPNSVVPQKTAEQYIVGKDEKTGEDLVVKVQPGELMYPAGDGSHVRVMRDGETRRYRNGKRVE